MKARYLHEIDIELAIEHGEMFSDKVSGEIAYNGRTRLLTFAVVTQLSDQPNKLIIKRLSPAYSKAKKKKGKRTYAAHDKKTIKR